MTGTQAATSFRLAYVPGVTPAKWARTWTERVPDVPLELLQVSATDAASALRDGTAGTTSYGGGRYLLDTAKGADLGGDVDSLIIDLNFAYHPSCRYNPEWVCPLAPAGNTTSIPVNAGETMAPAS